MLKMRGLFRAVGLLWGVFVVGHACADGYRNPPVTAEGIAKSGANRVYVQDASAMYYNPANLTDLTRPSYVFGLTLARSENRYTGMGGTTAETEGDWVPLPDVFFSAPVGDSGVTLGVAMTSPYGQGACFNRDELVASVGIPAPVVYEAEMMVVNVNPTVAFKVAEPLSVGVGADLYYSRLTMDQYVPLAPGVGQDLEADGDGIGMGGNVGITWDLTEKQRLAFTYVSQFKVEYDGDLDVTGAGPLVSSGDYSTSITFPDTYGLGYGIEMGDHFRMEVNLEWLRWSLNDTLMIDAPPNGPQGVPQKWEDTFTLGVGGAWQVSENVAIRAGYAFIETPIPDETLTPILPDMDRHVISLGMGWKFGNHGLDVAYSHSIYKERDTFGRAGVMYPGSYKTKSNLAGLTYSYVF